METASLFIGKRQVSTYHDESYAKLRAFFGVESDFLQGGVLDSRFSFSNMKGGGGKGGQCMAFDDSRKYIIKEMNETDHVKLLELADDYVLHVTEGASAASDLPGGCQSLLCRFFAHFFDKTSQKQYAVMNNWLPRYSSYTTSWGDKFDVSEQETAIAQLEASTSILDLKGSADDKMMTEHGHGVHEVHKRIWNLCMWCGRCAWTKDRLEYYEGKRHAQAAKFFVTTDQKEWIMTRIKRDIAWLIDKQLMVSSHASCKG